MKNLMEVIRMTRSTIICISFVIVSLMFPGQSYATVDPATILGVWLLDEGTGNTTADSSGNGNDGTIVGAPAWVAGQSGSALQFNGSSSYVTCGNAEALNVGVFSVSFWYNFPATQYWNHMISRGEHHGGNPGAVNWGVMMYDAQQTILYETYNNTVKPSLSVNTTAGQWHHVVATHDGATMQLYHDGQLAGATSTAGILLDKNLPFIIGAQSRASGPSDFFNGSIDEVGYFSAVLTPDDVRAIMNDGLAAVVGVGNPRARRPDPKDGALVAQTWLSMSWTAGDLAVTHDIYLGENFEDVNAGTGDTFRGNLTSPLFLVGLGLPGDPYPAGIVPGTTYYWRIDEVNNANPDSPWKGPVWSFFVPTRTAYSPNPSDGAKFTPTDVKLAWTPGLNAKLHYVYFGDNPETVGNATVGTPMGTTSFTPPGPLALDKTYYWRVDEFDGTAKYKGGVWSFTTTIAGLGTAVMERWENISGTALSGLTSDPRYPNNPTVTETVTRFAWDGPNTDNYGARIHGCLYVPATGDYTFWLNTDDNGELWLSTDDDPANMSVIARETSYTNLNIWGNGEEQSQPISLVGGEKYYFEALWKEGGGGDHCQVAWQGPGIATRTIIPGTNISPYKPLSAYGAKPSNGAAGVEQAPTLKWKPGLQAASHELYFGTDPNAVKNATQTSPEYKGTRTRGSESYAPATLGWQTTYYWRVDEVNNVNPGSPWVGRVWSFTTADYGVVDDFEFYDVGNNEIWWSWRDGLGYVAHGTVPAYPGNGTGAAVGDELTSTYAERTIVHGGQQSMPLSYDNNQQGKSKYSEAELTLTSTRDWTIEGVTALSLWYYGNSANSSERMYVSIANRTGTPAIVYNDVANATMMDAWRRWVIPIQDFASQGINIRDVDRIVIGFGTKGSTAPGGTGQMYIDDIGLYRSASEPEEILLEAEAGTITAPMKTYIDPLASGGGYIGTDEGIGDENNNPPATGVATYSFTAQGGVYKILLRVSIAGGSNSVWVRIPGATNYDPGTDPVNSGWIRFNDISDGAAWHWDEVHSNDHGNAVVNITLPAGAHTLEIARREDGAKVDAVVIMAVE